MLPVENCPKIVTLTFCQWAKWNPRKDIKNPTWFAMSNRITEDDAIQTLTDREFRAFVHLFCVVSQNGKPSALVNLEKAHRLTGIEPEVFIECIEKLASLGVCTVAGLRTRKSRATDAPRTRSVREPSATVQDNTEQDRNGACAPPALQFPTAEEEQAFWDQFNAEAAETLAELEPLEEQLPLDPELMPEGPETVENRLEAASIVIDQVRYPVDPKGLASVWDAHCGPNCAGIRDLTDARVKKARAQIKKYPDAAYWHAALVAFAAHTVPGWKFDFDDFLDEIKRTRALEDKYAGSRGPAPPRFGPPQPTAIKYGSAEKIIADFDERRKANDLTDEERARKAAEVRAALRLQPKNETPPQPSGASLERDL